MLTNGEMKLSIDSAPSPDSASVLQAEVFAMPGPEPAGGVHVVLVRDGAHEQVLQTDDTGQLRTVLAQGRYEVFLYWGDSKASAVFHAKPGRSVRLRALFGLDDPRQLLEDENEGAGRSARGEVGESDPMGS